MSFTKLQNGFLISCALLACLIASENADAAPSKEQKHTKEQNLPAHYHKDVLYADAKDPFYMDMLITNINGKPCVIFESYSPVTNHTSSFTAPAKYLNENTLSVSFTDDWGSKGAGLIDLKKDGAVAKFKMVASSASGLNASESWPENELIPRVKLDISAVPKKCCNPSNK
ncbi:MAG: hypothetical protein K2X77_08595 [Candidatus Obscuribacterales bacterium]|jgi:hypothetical protein|nr:hypothetical protein [Candidatus Obscuribacterales bacterium]